MKLPFKIHKLIYKIFKLEDVELVERVKTRISLIGYYDEAECAWDNPYKGNIIKIQVIGSTVILTCIRPGFIIGPQGKNFDYMKRRLEDIGITDIKLVEDTFWKLK